MQVIITADRAILPQSALGRPEHAEFVDKLMATIREAYVARCRLDEEGEDASLDSGKVSAIPKWLWPFQRISAIREPPSGRRTWHGAEWMRRTPPSTQATVQPSCEC